MNRETTLQLSASPQDIARAANLVLAGKQVAFPTETVYGLGADATNGAAVAGIYAAKGRPSFNPLIAHVADPAAAARLVQWGDMAQCLADAFWPGPLTLVLPLRSGHPVASLVTAGLPTLAVRVPAHPTARALLAKVDRPVAAPSANPSGQISPTTAAHVLEGLNGKIAAVLDDGPCHIGLESTIVGLDPVPTLLRPGGVPTEAVEQVLGQPLATPRASSGITAPGQMTSHYAPSVPVTLNQTEPAQGGVLLGFGDTNGTINLSCTGDLGEAAANLFDHLHRLNAMARPIAVAPIPENGLGAAINDRLRRAAADRDDRGDR